MREKFCPKCGIKTEKFYENVCEKCFLEKFSLKDKIPNTLLIKECKFCKKFFFKDVVSENLEELIESVLGKILEKEKMEWIDCKILGENVLVKMKIKVDDLEKIEEASIKLIIKKFTCNFCSMERSGYYQAILQVRVKEEIKREIEREVEEKIEVLRKFDSLAFVSKVEEQKNGIDFYIGSKKSANEIANFLKKKYKAKIKISRKLFGFERGKRVYRDTILISI